MRQHLAEYRYRYNIHDGTDPGQFSSYDNEKNANAPFSRLLTLSLPHILCAGSLAPASPSINRNTRKHPSAIIADIRKMIGFSSGQRPRSVSVVRASPAVKSRRVKLAYGFVETRTNVTGTASRGFCLCIEDRRTNERSIHSACECRLKF